MTNLIPGTVNQKIYFFFVIIYVFILYIFSNIVVVVQKVHFLQILYLHRVKI